MKFASAYLLTLALTGAVGIFFVVNAEEEKSRIAEVRERVAPDLKKDVSAAKLQYGAPIFIRIFKESRELELWIQEKDKDTFKLYKTWEIATYGGRGLGPKLAEGDGMAPEGFYAVGQKALNPNSSYHLSFNVGYPNAYDLAHDRTGSLIMVHGSNVSIGCFAMTDAVVEHIYLLAESALQGGQKFFRVHSFPFRMTAERMEAAADSPHYEFWKNLKEGYDAFEESRIPPNIEVDTKEKRYRVEAK